MLRALKGRKPARRRSRVLVIERGARSLRVAGREGFDETVAVVQMVDEPHEAFAQRALRRLTSLAESGQCAEAVSVLLGDDEPGAAAGRRRLVHEALSQPCLRELSLEAPSISSPTPELLGLVDEALAERTPVLVRLRFGAEPEHQEPRSGVFWSAPPERHPIC